MHSLGENFKKQAKFSKNSEVVNNNACFETVSHLGINRKLAKF